MTFLTDKELLLAFCGCDLERFTLTRGALKQKWPVCGCNKSMRIKNVPTSAFSNPLRMGDAGWIPKPVRGSGDSD